MLGGAIVCNCFKLKETKYAGYFTADLSYIYFPPFGHGTTNDQN